MRGETIVSIMERQYNGEFTVEERKAMTAKTIRDLRQSKKLSQKEVAGLINIPATTYNTYESGRTEPPIEILVRLSHLYQLPIDVIVQRDRTFHTPDEMQRQIAEYTGKLAEIDRAFEENEVDNPLARNLLDTLNKLTKAMNDYAQTEAVKNSFKEN